MHQENKVDSTPIEDPRPVPANMIKFGTVYTWDWGTASIFNSFFSKPSGSSDPIKDNPEPKAINMINAKIDLDLSKWMRLNRVRSTFTFRIENLFDKKIYVPPFDVAPNSVPYGPGTTFYAGLTVKF